MIEFAVLASVAIVCAVAAYAFRLRRDVAVERIESEERRHQCTMQREAKEAMKAFTEGVDVQLAQLKNDMSKLAMQAGLRAGGR